MRFEENKFNFKCLKIIKCIKLLRVVYSFRKLFTLECNALENERLLQTKFSFFGIVALKILKLNGHTNMLNETL